MEMFSLSFLDCSLWVYNNKIGFCVLIKDTEILLNLSFTCSNLWILWFFYIHSTMPSLNSDTWISSFTIWVPFISYSCLANQSRTSRTILNSSRVPCLDLDLREKVFSHPPLNMMLAWNFHIENVPSFWIFLAEKSVDFAKSLLCKNWNDHMVFFPHCINAVY